jgi:predicted enzyme related to lactoylglutathione lyase
MDMKIEVVILPVSDVDRAKAFYEKLRFRMDIDYAPNESYRIIQFTPPGSDASIIFGKGVTSAKPGSVDHLLMVVADIGAARDQLLSHGVQVSEVFHDVGGGLDGGFHSGTERRVKGADPERRSYGSYASFNDPDGNHWLLQEIRQRLPGRVTSASLDGKINDILLDALKNASAAHGLHEKEIGKPDPDWPQWYARHMTQTFANAGYHLTGPYA